MPTNPEDFGIPQAGTPGGLQVLRSSVTRPANTTGYAQYDAILALTSGATAVEITGAVRAAGEVFRWEGVRLRSTNKLARGKTFRLHLFDRAPTLTVSDNGIFNPSGAQVLAVEDIAGYIGYADVTLTEAGSTTGAAGRANPDVRAVSPYTGTSLWWVLEVRDSGGYTPISGEVFHVALGGQWS